MLARCKEAASILLAGTTWSTDTPVHALGRRQAIAPDLEFLDLPPGSEDNGKVILLVGINTKGRVEAVRVLRDDWQAFEKSAVDTVRTWRFKPAEKDGKPVPVQITVDVKFRR